MGISLLLALTGSIAVLQACGSQGGADRGPPPAGTPAGGDVGGPGTPPSDTGPDALPSPGAPAPSPAAANGLTVFFMVDPRITTGAYMGERWVAPATFVLVVQGAEAVVAARAHMVDGTGSRDVTATWTAADPGMLAVSPVKGHEVAIAVRRPGRSALTVASAEGSRELTVVAVRDAASWRIDVSQ
jgi:hypothetical protein